jgi:hypothetical protein
MPKIAELTGLTVMTKKYKYDEDKSLKEIGDYIDAHIRSTLL